MRVVVIMMLTMTKVFGKETLNEGDKGKNLLPKVAKVWASILGPHIVHLGNHHPHCLFGDFCCQIFSVMMMTVMTMMATLW